MSLYLDALTSPHWTSVHQGQFTLGVILIELGRPFKFYRSIWATCCWDVTASQFAFYAIHTR
jgi:hypothetical protein